MGRTIEYEIGPSIEVRIAQKVRVDLDSIVGEDFWEARCEDPRFMVTSPNLQELLRLVHEEIAHA